MAGIASQVWRRKRVYANEVLDYEASFPDGFSLDREGKDAIDEAFIGMKELGVQVTLAWLFGTKMNLPASTGRQLELMGSGADCVHFDTEDSELHVTPGALALVGDTTNKGYLTCGEAVLTNTDWSLLICLNKPTRDNTDTNENSFALSQYAPFVNGAFWIQAANTGGFLATWMGATNETITLMNEGTSELRPLYVWAVHNSATRELKWYNAFSGDQIGATQTGTVAGFVDEPLYFGKIDNHPWPPRIIHSSGLIKCDGILSDETRAALRPILINQLLQRFNDNLAIFTNSVGAGGNAIPLANGYTQRLKVWGATNNVFVWMRPGLGAKSIWHQVPVDYEVPVGRQAAIGTLLAPPAADISATYYEDKGITIALFSDDQNSAGGLGLTIGGAANVLYSDYTHAADAFCDLLRAKFTGLRRIQTTMIAWLPLDLGTHDPLTWGFISTSPSHQNLRNWSALIRADARYDAVVDTYATFNLGWPTEVDGSPELPATDFPNGNPDLFPDDPVDPQHPNNLGHEEYLTIVQQAVASCRRYY